MKSNPLKILPFLKNPVVIRENSMNIYPSPLKLIIYCSFHNPFSILLTYLQYLSKLHINKLYPNSLNSPSLISYLHLSFSNLASIKLVLIINLFLYNKTIILFHPAYNSPPVSPDLVYVKNSLIFTCDIFSHARKLTHLCVT